MKNYKLAVGIATTIAVGFIVYFINQKKNTLRNRMVEVADAGYETAQDILYPLKRQRFRRFKSF